MGDSKKGNGWESSIPVKDDDDRTWAKVVQGTSRGPSWTSHRMSEEDIERLQAYFSKVLEFPDSMMDEARRQWENPALIVKSLGLQVLAGWVAKEFKLRLCLEEEQEIFSIADDHHII